MSSEIRDLLERMAQISDSELTPVGVRQGLNPQQKKAKQMPALFRPKTITVLGGKTDPQHPARGMAVGSMESAGDANTDTGGAIVANVARQAGHSDFGARLAGQNWKGLAETIEDIEEDMLGKIQRDLNDYLSDLRDTKSDDGQRKNKRPRRDQLGKHDKRDRSIVPRAENQLVKTLALEDGSIMEIHGDDQSGYEIRRGPHRMITRFPDLAQAEVALDLYRGHRKLKSGPQDYLDEK